MSEHATRTVTHDVVGVGFGPFNLALAVALEDQVVPVDALFLERKPQFSWQGGMLVDGARMQISCLKDLATLRDPASPFTFLQYLKAQGRLDRFINLGTLRPTRVEFNAYLTWAAEHVATDVRYGQEVLTVDPVAGDHDGVDALRITTRDTGTEVVREHLTRNLVLGAGSEARLPDGLTAGAGDRMFHARDFLDCTTRRFPDRGAALRFVVVGDGQSSAEIVEHLDASYPRARVTAVTRGIGYRPMDETPFVNEIFFAGWVDVFRSLPRAKREALLASVRSTNYAVVEPELIDRIYRRIYESSVVGDDRLHLRPFLDLTAATAGPDGVALEFRDWLTEHPVRIDADAVVFATGYRVPNPHPILAGLVPYLQTDQTGSYDVGRDYRVATSPGFAPAIFLQGYAEATHGISETLLSVACVRAGEIASSLRALAVTGPPTD